jgi:diphosphate-dependent phosphofructokinase
MKDENLPPLHKARLKYQPALPALLQEPLSVCFAPAKEQLPVEEKIQALLPLTSGHALLKGKKGEGRTPQPLQIGVVFSGGQAPGGHNVVTGIYDALQKLNPQSKLWGFLGGPSGIAAGKTKELTAEVLLPYRNQGGFDLLASGRTKIESEEQLQASLRTVQGMNLDGLVVIGGDDSNTNAALLAEYFAKHGAATRVVGVPKTIDGDLQNQYVGVPFGFDTACKTYSEIIGNIQRDALSAKKYYHFVKLMGRSASHIVLECALRTHPNLALIGEEIEAKKTTLKEIVKEIANVVAKRAALGKHFGVILIPEGLIEAIPECALLIQELNAILARGGDVSQLSPSAQGLLFSFPKAVQEQLLLQRDPHGNVQVSMIETELLLMELVAKEVAQDRFAPLRHFLGYEARAGYPSNFDCNYCYALGFAAALLVREGANGYMAAVSPLKGAPCDWELVGIPLAALMSLEMRKGKQKPVIKKSLVNLRGKHFQSFAGKRDGWALEDDYLYPGPIQFYGDPELTESVPLSL